MVWTSDINTSKTGTTEFSEVIIDMGISRNTGETHLFFSCSYHCNLRNLRRREIKVEFVTLGEDRKNKFTFSWDCVYGFAVDVRTKLVLVFMSLVQQISLRCAKCFTVSKPFIWFTQVVGLQSKQHRYWR